MRELNMSGNDNSATSRNGTSERILEQNSNREQRRSISDIHASTPVSPRVNGFSEDVQHINEPGQNSAMSPVYVQTRQPINEAVASAFQSTDTNMSQEFIDLIAQKVMQQMQASSLPTSAALPVQPPASTTVNHYDNFSQSSTSPTFSQSHVYTPPSPQRQNSTLNAHGYETGIRREMSPTHISSEDDRIQNDAEARLRRPAPPRRISTDHDLTVLEKIWGRFFDGQGEGTERLEVFLRGVAMHIIEDYEPKRSLIITSDKMQRYYEETKLTDQPEIYPWELVFDDRTSCVSRLYRSPAIKAEHHLIQTSTDARPDTPGLTPHGFATLMTLLIKAHPDQEFERLLKTVREMPINNPDTGDRFPKDLSRRLFPASSNEILATALASSFAEHCQLSVNPRQSSIAGSEKSQVQNSPPLSSRRPNPPFAYVEDAIDESEVSDSAAISAHASSAPVVKPVVSDKELSASEAKEYESHTTSTFRQPVASADFDGSEVPTPVPAFTQRPLERERNPYFGSANGSRNYDVSGSSSDEKKKTKTSSTNENDRRRTKSISSSSRSRPAPPPIAIHQRDSGLPTDMSELTRARTTTVGSEQGSSMHRTRSNGGYAAEVQPARRSRRNSAYGNDANVTRYHVKRSPSLSKSNFDLPRTSAPDIKPSSYQPTNTYPNNYPNPPSSRQHHESRDSRRKDRERSKDRDAEPRSGRPRVQSMIAPSSTDVSGYSDDYYRQQASYNSATGGYPPSAGINYQYPPTAYSGPRDARDSRDSRDNRDQPRDARESRDSRDYRDRDPRDPRDFRDPRDQRDQRESREPRESRRGER